MAYLLLSRLYLADV